jgi:exonuclease III
MLSRSNCDTECPNILFQGDRRPDPTKYRFMQFNAEWLFLDYCTSSDCPGNGCTWVNSSEAQIHMDYVSNVINELQPDTINICEVEGCDELQEIIHRTTTDYVPYLVKGTDSATGQNVGILTKIDPIINLYRTEDRIEYPIPNSTCNYNGTTGTYGVSKHYITEMKINNINIALIGAHLLAFPTDKQRCVEREAQSQVLQNIIHDYIQKHYEIIVAGDFNDFDGKVVDANNNYPISSVLDILKGNCGKYKYTLKTVGEKMPKSTRFSDWYDKNEDCQSSSSEFSQIDHILVTPYLYDRISNVFMYQSYKEYCGKYDSDHYPLIVDFLII